MKWKMFYLLILMTLCRVASLQLFDGHIAICLLIFLGVILMAIKSAPKSGANTIDPRDFTNFR